MFSVVFLMCLSAISCDAALVDVVQVQNGYGGSCPANFEKVSTEDHPNGDFNQGNYGEYIYLCAKWNEHDQPITDLAVVAQSTSGNLCGGLPSSWKPIRYQGYAANGDFNHGNGGKYIYLCYRKQPGADPIVALEMTGNTCDSGMSKIMTRLASSGNFNQGGRGNSIYLCDRKQAPTPSPTPAPTPPPTPTPTPRTECASGSQQCAHLASFGLLDEVAAFRSDQEAQMCMNSGMAHITKEVANTCTLSQVQGSPPCGTECWPILEPKILSVQKWCLEQKYSGLEKYNKCLLEHGCDKPPAKQCHDTDHGYSDNGGYPCYRYHGHESWCGRYDTGKFHGNSMCCACGGGGWACPDQSAADVMTVQGSAGLIEDYLSTIYLQLNQTAPESPIPMTHAKHEPLSLTLAFTGGVITAIMFGVISMRRLKGRRSSAAAHLLA